jgi:hypothetical protein
MLPLAASRGLAGEVATTIQSTESVNGMTMTTTPSRVEGGDVVAVRAPTLGWALRRALLGLFILVVTVAAAASLLYASIDPEEEAEPPAVSQSQ